MNKKNKFITHYKNLVLPIHYKRNVVS